MGAWVECEHCDAMLDLKDRWTCPRCGSTRLLIHDEEKGYEQTDIDTEGESGVADDEDGGHYFN